MSLGIALYTFAVAIGVVFAGGIIEVSENINTSDTSYMSMSSDLDSSYYPSTNNVSIKLGNSQTFSIYPNILTTWTLDNKNVYSGQTYILYTTRNQYQPNNISIGTHILEVNNIISKKTWHITITDI